MSVMQCNVMYTASYTHRTCSSTQTFKRLKKKRLQCERLLFYCWWHLALTLDNHYVTVDGRCHFLLHVTQP